MAWGSGALLAVHEQEGCHIHTCTTQQPCSMGHSLYCASPFSIMLLVKNMARVVVKLPMRPSPCHEAGLYMPTCTVNLKDANMVRAE